jgi:uncharacterized protein with HEPN domain
MRIRHDYKRVAHDMLWCVINYDLPTLYEVWRAELAAKPDC